MKTENDTVNKNSMEYLLNDAYAIDWNKRHPIQHWIDELFNEKDIAGYRPSYAILHPWKIVDYCLCEVKYAWQRVFLGWDERVIWSIDYHLAEMIPVWMRQLKRDKMGVPMMAYREEDLQDPSGEISKVATELATNLYDDVLEEIAIGFEAYIAKDEYKFKTPEEEKELEKKFENGFDLLRKWFGTFWD
jgi:hypothetical protein